MRILNKNEKDIYNKIFYKNILCQIDGNSVNYKEYSKKINEYKYSHKEKFKLLEIILDKYNLTDIIIQKKIKKCLPNGFNNIHIYEDNEYEALKKEFEGI
jgi:hypothetical protein